LNKIINKLKNSIWIKYIGIFYQYARWRFPALLAITTVTGMLNVIGITMLLPIINLAFNQNPDNKVSEYILTALDDIGITATIGSLLIILVVIYSIKGFAVMAQIYFSGHIITTVKCDIRKKITNLLNLMTYRYYADQSSGTFTNVVNQEVNRFSSSMRAFCRLIISIIHALLYIPAALIINPTITLIFFLIGAISFIFLRKVSNNTAKLSINITKLNNKIFRLLIQTIQSFSYLKATSSFLNVSNMLRSEINDLAKKELKIIFNIALLESLKEPIAVIALVAFIYYQVVIVDGNVANIMILSLILYRLLILFLTIPGDHQKFNRTVGGVLSVEKTIDELSSNKEIEGAKNEADILKEIKFENVYFKYDEKVILSDISINIKPFETIGIVGDSGAGKTTLFYLLTGLLKPSSGRIMLGNIDYSSLKLSEMRRFIGYVTQEPFMFDDTIANNVSLWEANNSDHLHDSTIISAIKAAQCEGFVNDMPSGLNTILGEKGIKISGGQRQRIAIARELFKDPQLLIFDEATSALDSGTENYIKQEIAKIKGKKTMLIIAHRLSTIMDCDRVYILSNGSISETGTTRELYDNKESIFFDMCQKQGITI